MSLSQEPQNSKKTLRPWATSELTHSNLEKEARAHKSKISNSRWRIGPQNKMLKSKKPKDFKNNLKIRNSKLRPENLIRNQRGKA